ncbi:MAG: HD domain-containing protein [Lachnospiraceae bacterium]|jgi:HD-GYP domain-containing protein (c-di-GMP phosphodiesterase class II)|nr:HD domain-containing protein [Lachnospiraceae bacterium]MCI9396197.1 HD domain-containing protein [Lachnospiraceae bacterium]
MSVISSKDVNEIIRKTLGIINNKIMHHGEITGYILYKMMEYENAYTDQNYTEQELVDYTMLGILHDIGLYKEDNVKNVSDFETKNLWPHSIYGFLFLKYLSPIGDRAEIVLYHHLDYNRYSMIQSRYLHVTELLNLADKMDTVLHLKEEKLEQDYFSKYRNIKFSGAAMDLFQKAEKCYGITDNLVTGKYREELDVLLAKRAFSEQYKKGFLEMLVYTIDFRSEHTVIHTLATVNFAEQLGRLARVSGKDLRDLHYGALLHDLGKIAIPLHILESTGRLSDDEMKVMKAHVRITEMILEGVVDDAVLQIAVRHHEKLDGTGYHRGLSAADLTLPQQIIAVADILSALYGKRSYKEAFSKEKILDIMNSDADKGKINRNVVTTLEKSYDSIIEVFEKEKENTIGLYLKIKEQYAIMIERFKKFG